MRIVEKMVERAKKLSLFDVKLAQASSIFFGLIIAKLIPEIMEANIWLFVALWLICALKPTYSYYF